MQNAVEWFIEKVIMYTDGRLPQDAIDDLRQTLMNSPGDLQTFEDNMMENITRWVMKHAPPELPDDIKNELPPGMDPTKINMEMMQAL